MDETEPRGHEVTDAAVRPVLWVAGILLGAGIAIHVALGFQFRALRAERARENPPPSPLAAAAPAAPPEPRLQTSPTADLADLRRAEDAALEHYGWVDQRAGIVRIPIERAMELVAKGGG